MGMGGTWELVDGKNGNGIYVSDGNGKGMGIKSLKWEEFGTKNLFPYISIFSSN
jgi:hypothetical protein